VAAVLRKSELTMASAALPSTPNGWRRLYAWPRLRVALMAAATVALLVSFDSPTPLPIWLLRTVIVALGALTAFGLAERWPRRLPRWLARWVWQLVALVMIVPPSVILAYWISVGGNPQFSDNPARLTGFGSLSVAGVMFGLWLGMTAVVRQRDAQTREQALTFERERSELARQALDARMRLMQAQVQPHFLFNTLANVQALVDAGSPQASAVLRGLVTYLRAAVPRLDERDTTLGQEVELVRAYLALMQMRMPDRLQYSLDIEPSALPLRCPPMVLHTLVENAVRHGIDPSEEGGRIDILVERVGERWRLRVSDDGMGLRSEVQGLGTGLSTLRERLKLAYGDSAQLVVRGNVRGHERGGVTAVVELPTESVAAKAEPPQT
jgi:signal transduction histidine kinase